MRNLVTNPSFEVSTAGWSVTGGSVARQTTWTQFPGQVGGALAGLTADGSSNRLQAYPSASFPVRPGESVGWLAFVACDSAVRVRAAISFYDASNTWISEVSAQRVMASFYEGVVLRQEVVAPAGVASWRFIVRGELSTSGNIPSGSRMWIDGVRAVSGSAVEVADALDQGFRDGDSEGWYWLGTPGLSASAVRISAFAFPSMEPVPRVEVIGQGFTSARVSVYRVSGAGVPVLVPGADRIVAADPFAVVDYEAPFNVPVSYMVEQFDEQGVSQGFSTSAPVSLNFSGTVLQHPLVPSGGVRIVDLAKSATRQGVRFRGALQAPGSRRIGAWLGAGRDGIATTLRFATDTDSEFSRIQSMLDVSPVLMLRTSLPMRLPQPFYFAVQEPEWEGFDWHVRGSVTEWEWEVEQAARQSPRLVIPPLTYADIEATYATYADLASDNATYADVARRWDLAGRSRA